MSMQEQAPAPHMKGVVWEYFRGENRDGPEHDAGWSSAVSFWSSWGRILSSLGKAWRTRGAPRARSARRSRPGRAERLGRGPEPEEVRASAALVGCSRRAEFWCPRRVPASERWRRWSGARAGCLPPVRGLACRVTLPRPAPWPASVRVVCGEVEGGRRTMTRTATAPGWRVAWCMVVPVSHGHIAGRDAVPTISRGRGAPVGGVGRRWRAAVGLRAAGVPHDAPPFRIPSG